MKIPMYAMIVSIFFSGVALADAPPPVSTETALKHYLKEAEKLVNVQAIVLEFGSGKNEGYTPKLKPEYDAAKKQLDGNQDAQKSLKAHWIKLNQCLSAGLSAHAVDQCKYELNGLAAQVEVDAEP
jgi:hypothetical protein